MENTEEMDTFLEMCNLQKLNQEEIENMNQIKVIKKILTNKKFRTRWFYSWVPPKIWRRVNTYPSEIIPENSKGRNTSEFIVWEKYHRNTKPKMSKNARGQLSLVDTDTKSSIKYYQTKFNTF